MGRPRRSLVAAIASAISFGALFGRGAEFSPTAASLPSAFASLGFDIGGLFRAVRISSPLCERIASLRLPGHDKGFMPYPVRSTGRPELGRWVCFRRTLDVEWRLRAIE